MNDDPTERVAEQHNLLPKLATKFTTPCARLPTLARWRLFAGISLAFIILLTLAGILGNALLKPHGVPLSLQQTATAELLAKTGRPELGASITRFIGVYGQPSSSSSPSDGLYDFNHILEVFTSHRNNRVNAASFLNSDGNGWNSLQSALPDCEKLIPRDALYQRIVELYNPANGLHVGTERVYLSPSLASLFQASDFTDEHRQVTTAGIFAIVFHYVVPNSPGMTAIPNRSAFNGLKMSFKDARSSHDSPPRIADCNPQIGLEPVQQS